MTSRRERGRGRGRGGSDIYLSQQRRRSSSRDSDSSNDIKSLPVLLGTSQISPPSYRSATISGNQELSPEIVKSLTGLSLSTQPLQAKIDSKIPKAPRQPPGTQGHPIGLIANYFILKYKNINIYHYDIEIKFLRQNRKDEESGGDTKKIIQKMGKSVFEEGRTAKEDAAKKVSHVEHQLKRAPGKERCREIITEMCKREELKSYYPVYDGQKNLYTLKPLPIENDGKKSIITLEEDSRIKQFEVTVKPVEKKGGGNEINLALLQQLYEDSSSEIPQEAIMAFDTVMCHRNPPVMQVQVGRSFFSINDKKDTLGEGLEIWYGYNQSVHLIQRGPAVIVNFAAKAFHQDGNVIECASRILNTDITKHGTLDARKFRELEDALSKVKVNVLHQKYPRKYTIKGLTKTSAKDTRFKVDDKTEISVADYFKENYKPLQYPHLPCLYMRSSKNTTFIPMEVCRIYPGQPKLGKLSSQMTSQMIRKTAIPPAERFRKIQENAELIKHVSGQLMNEYGLQMELKFMQFYGRVIEPPKLAYRSSDKEPSLVEPDQRGTWKIDGKNFFKSNEPCSWILLSFANERFCNNDNLKKFADILWASAQKVGMNLEKPKSIKIFGNKEGTYSALKIAKDANVTFAVVVLSSKCYNHSYDEVKFVAETKLKVLTQCMDENVVVHKFNHQVATSVLLKINSKLGGVNHILNPRPIIFSRPIIVFGADASHSPRGYQCPSIAAVVGSLDAFPARYAVTCRVQQNPDQKKLSQEIIVELKDMVKEILQAFLINTSGKKPEKILFFRDGVSEGQFDAVLQNEIEAIQLACKEILNDFIPPMTFIVVQKRHQTRLKPQNPKDGVGRPGNVPPGTVADTDIVHPVYFDFFLCSHEGIQGTSKPARYTVLYDENQLSSDELQILCYHLCHMYARCNRSISVPAPVMYADLACTRAKKYADWYLQTQDQSVSSASSDGIQNLPDEIITAITNMKNFDSRMFYI